jgi:hypothetical protein
LISYVLALKLLDICPREHGEMWKEKKKAPMKLIPKVEESEWATQERKDKYQHTLERLEHSLFLLFYWVGRLEHF